MVPKHSWFSSRTGDPGMLLANEVNDSAWRCCALIPSTRITRARATAKTQRISSVENDTHRTLVSSTPRVPQIPK